MPFWRIGPLEVAAGWITGSRSEWAASFGSPGNDPEPGPGTRSPLEALEDVIRPSLAASPCAVSFSGGRDSSLILAVASRLAQREGLPAPIAVSKIFPAVPTADETYWQELVIRHLGTEDWIRIDQSEDADLLSQTATASLRRNGLVWPAPGHSLQPLFEHAAGGVLITGEGGDEWFGHHRATSLASFKARRGRRNPELYKAAWTDLSPAFVRRRRARRSAVRDLHWLRTPGREDFARQVGHDQADTPLRWDRSLEFLGHRTAACIGSRNMAAFAALSDVRLINPLQSRPFTRALQAAGGRLGYSSRTELMVRLFNGLLPDQVIRRADKRYLDDAAWGPQTRAFIGSWHGAGVDGALVDPEALRLEWGSAQPHACTTMLLHSAWLHAHDVSATGATGDQPL